MSADDVLENGRFSSDATLQQVARGEATLQRGAQGDAVLLVQQALNALGFNLRQYVLGGRLRGGADGAFGPQTETALRNFQVHAERFFRDAPINGILDGVTLQALDRLSPPPGRSAWEAAESVKIPGHQWGGDPGKGLRVVVVKREHRTFLFDRGGRLTGIFPNATGAQGTATDPGLKMVVGKLEQRDAEAVGRQLWNDPAAFGVRIINLSWADGRSSGEELHGTNHPDQMGMNVSHGCVRHYNEDIVQIFGQVALRDRVAIVEWIDDPALSLPAPIA